MKSQNNKVAVLMMDGSGFERIYENNKESTKWGTVQTPHISSNINWSIILTGEKPSKINTDIRSSADLDRKFPDYEEIEDYSVLNYINSNVGTYNFFYKNVTGIEETVEHNHDKYSLDLSNPDKVAIDYPVRETIEEAFKYTSWIQSKAKKSISEENIRVAFIYNHFTDLLHHQYCQGAADELIEYSVNDMLEVVDKVLLISDHKVLPRGDTRQQPAKHQGPAEYCIYPSEDEYQAVQIHEMFDIIKSVCNK